MVLGEWRRARERVRFAFAIALALGCTSPPEKGSYVGLDLEVLDMSEPLCPLPAAPTVNEKWVSLGEALFQERALSGDQKVACADCHLGNHGLADENALSRVEGRKSTILNAPTMYNSVYSYRLTWGGRYDSLEEHLDDLMKNPDVMASSWEIASRQLKALPAYEARFRDAFEDGVQPQNVRTALVEYEKSLVTPDAPFDRYLEGKADAISEDAKRGYSLFKAYGCASCHQGCGIGGNMLEQLGILGNYFSDHGGPRPADDGLFKKTGLERDRYVFRVPSLRNVARTAPYFHDGSVATLEAAIGKMARYQLGRELEPKETHLIAEFLRTLTGHYRGKPI